MTPPRDRVVIVGASTAGLNAAEAVREGGFAGEVVIVGEEIHPPYDRPPLSKQILSGAWEPDRAVLRSEAELRDLGVDLILGRRAVALDPGERTVSVDDGRTLPFDAAVIATGVTPRQLPGATGLRGAHLLRTVDNALALREELLPDRRVVVIGSGFLGSEVAAVACAAGADVTLVSSSAGPLSRVAGARLASLLADLHRAHGVDVRTGRAVSRIVPRGDAVAAVELADGTLLKADVVLAAIGSDPATGWLRSSGLDLGDGVLCDDGCRAAPRVWAAGDVARWPNRRFDVSMRLEHQMNAGEQGRFVGEQLLGAHGRFEPIPYFWSDQYDVKVQGYGIFPSAAEPTVTDGRIEDGRFVMSFTHAGRVVGAVGWNMPRGIRAARAAIDRDNPVAA
jgi:3-phenylpropionate/trans-cinnamate dioxygenase ferredoxin reductase component